MPYNHKEYMREYHIKHKEKRNQYAREWYMKNKDYQVEYRKTDKGYKMNTISCWKNKHKIKCDEEWDEVYEWWMSATHCDICDCEFKKGNKCLDHDHTLEGYNVRGVICRSCNMRDNR
jgi:hypothetical protein